jgi:hypothetical protein
MKKYLILNSIIDFIFLAIGFLFMAKLKPGAIEHVIAELWVVFLIFSGIWLVTSLISGKYLDPHKKSLVQLYSGIIIADVTLLFFTAIAILIFRPTLAIHLITLGTGGIAFILEVLFATYVFYPYKYIAITGKRSFNMRPVAYPDVVDPDKEQELKVTSQKPKKPKEFNIEAFMPLQDDIKSAKELVTKRLRDSNSLLFDLIARNISLDCIFSIGILVTN